MGDVLNRGTKDKPRWYCRFVDADGKRKQRATSQPTRALALRVLAEIEARICRGQVGVPELAPEECERAQVTVRELAERFLEEYRSPRLKDLARYRREARTILGCRVLPVLGDRPAASVTTRDLERLRDDELAAGLAPASVVQTIAALSKLYALARKVGAVDCPHPATGCTRPRPAESIDFLDHAEVGRLLVHAERAAPALHPMIATAIYAGLRKGELFGLRWSDLALDAGRIDVNRSYLLAPKSGKPRHVPIHPSLAPILRAWRDRCPATEERLAFPVPSGPGHRMGRREDTLGLEDLLRAAGCHAPAMPWHALRHSFAAHAVMGGASLYAVQRLLGHSSPLMTQRYAHLAPDFLAAEVARIAFAAPPAAGIADLGEARRLRAVAPTD